MVIRTDELLKAAQLVAEQQNLTVTVKCSSLGALFTGGTTAIGGLLLGPVGLAIGGTAGGILSYLSYNGKFKSVAEIIKNDLTPRQKTTLVTHLTNALKDVDITDATNLALLVMHNESVMLSVAMAVKTFIQNDMRLELSV